MEEKMSSKYTISNLIYSLVITYFNLFYPGGDQ